MAGSLRWYMNAVYLTIKANTAELECVSAHVLVFAPDKILLSTMRKPVLLCQALVHTAPSPRASEAPWPAFPGTQLVKCRLLRVARDTRNGGANSIYVPLGSHQQEDKGPLAPAQPRVQTGHFGEVMQFRL